MRPEISVIITTYNTEKYIERAICSVLDQTFQSFEIIVVDDASSDGTVDVVRSMADERIRLVVREKNIGMGACRNIATKLAKGRWIALLDSDDWYDPGRFDKLLELARSHDADMVADDLHLTQLEKTSVWSSWFKESGCEIEDETIVDSTFFVKTDQFGQRGLHLGLTKPMFKRDFLLERGLEYDEGNRLTPDYWFYLKCLVEGAKFVLTSKAYYFQFFRRGSLMRSGQISRLNVDIETSKRFLSWDKVQQDADLVAALKENLVLYHRYIAYYHVADPLNEKNWPVAFRGMVQHPTFFLHFARKLPAILSLRMDRYLGRNSDARNSMLPS